MQVHKYDVVIVGAGGAGMRAAIEAGQRVRTAVLTKLYPTRSHTGAAQGGMCAALANVEEDNWEWHTFDTIKGGDYLVDQDAAEIMCKEAIDAVLDLEKMGLPFNRTPEGRIDQRRFGGHTRDHGKAAVRRACYAADRTGHMILQTLYQNCVKHGVEFFNEFYVLDVLHDRDRRTARCAPARSRYELATGEIHVFQAKAVVFATGGFGKVFKTTSNAHTLTGDGMGIIFRKGLPLEDMEFYQFHPTGLAGLGILLTEGARGEGGSCATPTASGSWSATPPPSRTSRRATSSPARWCMEVLEGRGAGPNKDYVLLDCTHLRRRGARGQAARHHRVRPHLPGRRPGAPSRCRSTRPRTTRWAASRPTSTARCCATTTTSSPGLYAAGECACVSVHGANRLGTNSLLDINVFGRRAGIAAAEYAASVPTSSSCRRTRRRWSSHGRAACASTGTERVADIRTALQNTMDANAAVYRTEDTLKQAAERRAAAQGAVRHVSVQDKGKRLQHRPARGRRARLPAGTGRGHCRRRPGPQGVPRRTRPRGLPEP